MSVVIRLMRAGAKKRPFFRMVAADSRRQRDGRFLEILGHYNPLTQPFELMVHKDRIETWISKGAQPSEQVASLLRSLGIPTQAPATRVASPAAGDKPAHYHVDMRFPDSGLARVEVDATTLELASRFPERIDSGAATLPEVASLIGGLVPGQITAVELDSTVGTPAHYDIDVRLPDGPTARLKVDARTCRIAWREPAVVAD